MAFFGGGFHGFPGHGGEKEDVDTTKLYELLNVPKEASQQEIKKAFRKAAMKHHPDKGGDPETVGQTSSALQKEKEIGKIRSSRRQIYKYVAHAVQGNQQSI